jgi:hypothetical protein
MTVLAAVALAYALSAGISVAFGAETWSAGSGSFSSSHASGARSYTYQNVGGVQSWQHDTPGGHSTTTYRPAGTPGHGNYVFDNTGTGATARTNVNVPYAAGKTGTASVTNALSKAGIAAAAAGIARLAGPVALAASAVTIYDALTDDGYSALPGSPDTWAMEAPDTPPSPTAPGGGYYANFDQARAQLCAPVGYSYCSHAGSTSGGFTTIWCKMWTKSGEPSECHPVTSGYPPGWTGGAVRTVSYGTGASAGTCPTGQTYSSSSPAGCWVDGSTRAATPEELEAMEAAIVDGCPGGCGFGPMAVEVLDAGASLPADAWGPTLIVIPDSGVWPGDSQTTTHPDGTQTVTDNEYNASASGDTVEVTKTTTVTEKDALGNVTSVTTTEGQVSEGEQKQLCEMFPDVVACWTAGDVPAAEPLDEETITVSLTPETVAGGVGSCPADIPLSIGGQSFALSWSSVCQFATGVNPIVIALGWIAAGYLLFGSVRGRA